MAERKVKVAVDLTLSEVATARELTRALSLFPAGVIVAATELAATLAGPIPDREELTQRVEALRQAALDATLVERDLRTLLAATTIHDAQGRTIQ